MVVLAMGGDLTLGQTHLNFIENKGFINICNNLAIEKDGFSVVFKQKSLFVFSL
jgi:hypothetical protein